MAVGWHREKNDANDASNLFTVDVMTDVHFAACLYYLAVMCAGGWPTYLSGYIGGIVG